MEQRHKFSRIFCLRFTEPYRKELRTLEMSVGNDTLKHEILQLPTSMLMKLALHSLAMALASMVLILRQQDTIFNELLWVVDGVLNCLLQLQFDLLQTTNIVPSDSGHFDDSFVQRRWVGGAESEPHILHRDAESRAPPHRWSPRPNQ